jgi:transcriptional regulator with XRE-family HTH domain
MDELLRNILKIKSDKNITDRQFQKDLGLYASAVSEWKNGSSKSYEKHLVRIAKYLDVSVDTLLGKKTTPSIDEQLDGVDFALSGEIRDLSDAEKQDLLDYIRFKKSKRLGGKIE